jgi:hypothetical protein
MRSTPSTHLLLLLIPLLRLAPAPPADLTLEDLVVADFAAAFFPSPVGSLISKSGGISTFMLTPGAFTETPLPLTDASTPGAATLTCALTTETCNTAAAIAATDKHKFIFFMFVYPEVGLNFMRNGTSFFS